jgi:predicted RNA-binding Zn ribbon-like protein
VKAAHRRRSSTSPTTSGRLASSIRQRFDALFTKDEEHAAAAAQDIENLAYHEAQEAAAAYDHVQVSLTDVITQARDLRTRIQRGMVTEKDARKLLADLRKHCAKLVAKIAPTKSRHDSAQATLKDPAAKREALIARFPALRR